LDESKRLKIREERRKRRERRKKILIGLAALLAVILVAGVVILVQTGKKKNGTETKDTSAAESSTTAETKAQEASAASETTEKDSEEQTEDTSAEETEAAAVVPERPAVDSGYVSSIPVLFINAAVESFAGQPKDTSVDGTYELFGKEGSGLYYSGSMTLTGRGNSTWELDKKCFDLNLNEAQDLLGLGKSGHWALVANRTDPSFMRDHMAYTLSEKWGMLSCKGTWVDVVVNGSEYGNYYLVERVETGENRVEITTAETAADAAAEAVAEARTDLNVDTLKTALKKDLSWISTGVLNLDGQEIGIRDYYDYDSQALIRSGYLMEINGFMDEESVFYTNYLVRPVMVKTPASAVTNGDMMTYLKKLMNAFDRGLNDGTFRTTVDDAEMSVYDIVDRDTLIAYFWVNEIFMNADGWYRSFYFYKDADTNGTISPFKIGPVWEVDYSSGGFRDNNRPYQTAGWGYETYWPTDQMTMNYGRYLVHDPEFVQAAYDFYKENRQAIFEMLNSCETYYAELEESASHDAARWGLVRNDFRTEVTTLEDWLNKRIAWLDEQVMSYDTLWKSFGN